MSPLTPGSTAAETTEPWSEVTAPVLPGNGGGASADHRASVAQGADPERVGPPEGARAGRAAVALDTRSCRGAHCAHERGRS